MGFPVLHSPGRPLGLAAERPAPGWPAAGGAAFGAVAKATRRPGKAGEFKELARVVGLNMIWILCVYIYI